MSKEGTPKIYAPFSAEVVAKLKEWQESGLLHPFTCCGHDGCERTKQPKEGALNPVEGAGWVCPCGKYTQNWCHAFMTY